MFGVDCPVQNSGWLLVDRFLKLDANTLLQAPPDRKSIGAEVNYGVRFDTQTQADGFLAELAVELSRRMAAEGVLGRALTLKIMKQRDVSRGCS